MLRRISAYLYIFTMLALLAGTVRIHLFDGYLPTSMLIIPGLILWGMGVMHFLGILPVVRVEEDRKRDIADAVTLVGAAVLTHLLVARLGLTAVMASALVGLFFGVFLRPVAVAAFCGSFVGMLAPPLYGFYGLVFAALSAAVLFQLGRGTFKGIGGKLGTTAFFGSMFAAFFFTPESFHFFANGIDLDKLLFTTSTDLILILLSGLASYATYFYADRYPLTVVITSAAVGIVGELVLPMIYPDQGAFLSVAVYCASFAGMTAKEHFGRGRGYFLAGMLSGTLFLFGPQIFVGFGGKLGTTAMISSLATYALRNLVQNWRLFGSSLKKMAS